MAKKIRSLCRNCGHQGYPKIKTPGYFAVEILLWLLFLLPGLCYTLWRVLNKFTVCPVCGQPHMLPMSSPVAKQMLTTQTPPPIKTPSPAADEFIDLPDPEPDPADILQPQDAQGRYIIE